MRVLSCPARAEEPHHLAPERRRLAGGEHDPRRNHRAGHHPAAEAGRRAGDRRVSAEQDRDVAMIRILRIQRSRASCSSARRPDSPRRRPSCGPSSRPCARAATSALLEYARSSTASTASSVRVPAGGARQRSALVDAAVPRGCGDRLREHPVASPSCSCREPGSQEIAPGLRVGSDHAAARYGLRLHPRRPLSSALDADDDGHPRAGRGRAEHLRRDAEAGRRDSRHRRDAGQDTCLPAGRRARHRGVRLRHARLFRARIASSDLATSMSPRRRSCSPVRSASISSRVPPRS